MKTRSRFILILIVFVFSLLVALPSSVKTTAFRAVGLESNGVAQWLSNQQISLGLDLQGGTQLDYKVDLRDVPQRDRNQVIEGVKAVFEKRVNGLGVSEPNIYTSVVGNEEHIIVELAGITDINEAKATIGKVIQLEFKVQNDAQESDQKSQIKKQAEAVLVEAKASPQNFETIGKENEKASRVEYKQESNFLDAAPGPVQKILPTLAENQVNPELEEGQTESTFEFVDGQVREVPAKQGYFIVKGISSEPVLRPDPKNAEDFLKAGQEVSTDKKVDLGFVRKGDLDPELQDKVFSLSAGNISDVLETSKGYYIAKLVQTLPKDEEMIRADSILIKLKPEQPTKTIDASLPDAEKQKLEEENTKILADNGSAKKYNEEEAPKRAQEALEKAKADPGSFAELVNQYSDDTAAKAHGGDMGFFTKDQRAPEIAEKAFGANKGDLIPEAIKTSEGYYILRVTDKKAKDEEIARVQMIQICGNEQTGCTASLSKSEAKTKADETLKRVREEKKYTYAYIYFSTNPDPWKPALATNPITKEQEPLTGKFFKRADLQYDSRTFEPVVVISFNDEGAKMFEELTGRLVNQPLAIFVGGELISAPTVNDKISGGNATISGRFSDEEAAKLQRDLNAGAIPAPITLVGEQEIGGSVGTEALNASLKAGLIGILVLILFMILYYRLPGLIASLALGLYVIVFIAFIKLWPGMVMTLAGIAGVILSIGVAVDGNILIFERVREELSLGKTLNAALKAGFERAWTSIRDSNSSSILTAIILLWFGTSIIKGFAFMLIVGVVLSLFSAIYVTRTLLYVFNTSRFEKNLFLWGAKKPVAEEGKKK